MDILYINGSNVINVFSQNYGGNILLRTRTYTLIS